jgi:phage recombination protein Bet
MTVMLAAERPTAPVQQQAGSLAIRADQTMWTEQQEAVLRQSGISDEVTRAELSGFLHLCQRTGLDPFSRQIYLIGRYDKRKQRTVFTPQTGIDGYRVIAQRVTGQTAGTYGYEDTLWCDASGRWRDVWLSDEPPAAAKVIVIRNGQKFSAVARFAEYAETWPDGNLKSMWAKMPSGQIAKCCEALALRKAFPHDLAGVYTAEEMAQADNPEPVPSFQRQAPAQDQWEQATPAPVQQTAAAPFDAVAEGDLSGGRDWINEATEAATADDVVKVWHEAKAAGAVAATLNEIVAVGKEKRATEQQSAAEAAAPGPTGSTAGSGTTAVPATERATASPTPEQAEERLRIAASRAHLTTVDGDFHAVYGLPIDQATAQQLDGFRARIEAAGGQQ